MKLLVGMDEAGYGPNLGPLVLAVTAWKVEGEEPALAEPVAYAVDLYERLEGIISHKGDGDRIAIADSKALYKPGGGLQKLERGVFAALAALGKPAGSWSALVEHLEADPEGLRHRLPWHVDFDVPLPTDATADEVAALGVRLVQVCDAAGVGLVAMRGRMVFPCELNRLIEQYGSKGAALSHLSLGMLREVMDGECFLARRALRCNAATIVCDKHGGRNRYSELLAVHFPEQPIEVLDEGRAESRYRWVDEAGPVDIGFRTKGESFLPTALASMTAKLLRELAMRGFNQFWQRHVPGLRPTAGYPQDAKRFRGEIADRQRQLGINDLDLWRNR